MNIRGVSRGPYFYLQKRERSGAGRARSRLTSQAEPRTGDMHAMARVRGSGDEGRVEIYLSGQVDVRENVGERKEDL